MLAMNACLSFGLPGAPSSVCEGGASPPGLRLQTESKNLNQKSAFEFLLHLHLVQLHRCVPALAGNRQLTSYDNSDKGG
jgi:hypothetical protein